jgi:sugar lactone lactonase YvrE
MRLHTAAGDETQTWQFDEYVSAAGWVDNETLILASQTGLMLFDIESGQTEFLCTLEADNDATRSNDGRADPMGGFWIGTMGIEAEPKAGAIYRYFEGSLRKIVNNLTIPNSICFAPDGSRAYYADTQADKIMQIELDEDGWPIGKAALFVSPAHTPDGSVVDAQGNLWNAQWDHGRVACYTPDGALLRHIDINAAHATCPAFGGPDGTTLFVTSAQQGLSENALAANPAEGCTFQIETDVKGQAEHQVYV